LEVGLNRREAVRLLGLGCSFSALPASVVAASREVHAGLTDTPTFKILSPSQDATVVAMAELILPRTETPGAKDTRVDEFIDRIVADWYSDEDRTVFLAGLADVDRRTLKLFGKNFVDVSQDQQSEILRALGDELAVANAAVANGPRGYRGEPPEPKNNFYLKFRELTLMGYFTSEAGFTRQLKEEIIPGRFDGCVELKTVTAKAESEGNQGETVERAIGREELIVES
jgi:Gluconate 2-dehydrogenase subunit 3